MESEAESGRCFHYIVSLTPLITTPTSLLVKTSLWSFASLLRLFFCRFARPSLVQLISLSPCMYLACILPLPVCRIAFAQFCSYFILTSYLFNGCFSLTLRFILLRFDYIVSLWFALFILIVGSLEISFVSGMNYNA